MSVSQQLLELFRVDKQLRGLRNRLDAAEHFLSQQSRQLDELDASKRDLEQQLKGLKASLSNEEGEAARVEKKLASVREQMNSAKNSKEYNAFLAELNNYKQEKGEYETHALEAMSKTEQLAAQLQTVAAQHAERAKIAAQAKAERDARHAEIKDRLSELAAQRDSLASNIPAATRLEFEQLIKARGDEAMAHAEVIDRRSHECSCSACMMAIPVEAVNALLSGKLTKCPSCRCFLYMEQSVWTESEGSDKKAPRKNAKAGPNGKAAKSAGEKKPAASL